MLISSMMSLDREDAKLANVRMLTFGVKRLKSTTSSGSRRTELKK